MALSRDRGCVGNFKRKLQFRELSELAVLPAARYTFLNVRRHRSVHISSFRDAFELHHVLTHKIGVALQMHSYGAARLERRSPCSVYAA